MAVTVVKFLVILRDILFLVSREKRAVISEAEMVDLQHMMVDALGTLFGYVAPGFEFVKSMLPAVLDSHKDTTTWLIALVGGLVSLYLAFSSYRLVKSGIMMVVQWTLIAFVGYIVWTTCHMYEEPIKVALTRILGRR